MLVRIVQVFAVLNTVLLAGLLYIWGRNWWQLRSKHTLGLVMFSAFLLAENLMMVYFFVIHQDLNAWIHNDSMVPPIAQTALATLRVLQFLGLSFLVWVTWD